MLDLQAFTDAALHGALLVVFVGVVFVAGWIVIWRS